MSSEPARPGRKVELRSGREACQLEVPANAVLLAAATPAPLADFRLALDAALDRPIGRPRLEEALKGRTDVTFLVPDKTRHAQTERILPVLMDRLRAAGARAFTVLVAAGDHPAHTEQELLDVVGPGAAEQVRILEHRAGDEASCVEVGRTTRGTPIRLNRNAVEGARLVLIGAASHHYFAGFGGGPKALFPGAAARSAIQANHGLVMRGGDKDPRARCGLLDGNPVHEDLSEAVSAIEPAFLINVVNDGDDRPLGIFAGHWREAHREACIFLDRVATLAAGMGEFDLLAVSAGGYPHDINLVQAHKAMDRCAPLLKDGGEMLLLAECAQGFGDPELEAWLRSADEARLLNELSQRFRVKAHTALCLMRKSRRWKVHVASRLDPTALIAAGLYATGEASAAWTRMVAAAGPEARVGIVPAGHFVVPR